MFSTVVAAQGLWISTGQRLGGLVTG